MANLECLVLSLLLFFQLGFEAAESKSVVNVGVLVDLNSRVDVMANICMSVALSDFYALHPNYQTRLKLHTRNSQDVLSAASAALDLLKNLGVQAIIGPQRSPEATFVIELGRKAHVPIISFSASNVSISPTQSPYFIQTAPNYSSEVKAITAMVKEFEWHEVVLLYDDTEYGSGIVPYITDAFQEVNVGVPYKSSIPTSAEDAQILKEMTKLMALQTRVFLVHMTSATLGSRLFKLANEVGMISEGYAWIATSGLSYLFPNDMDPMVTDSLEGVLGIRPFVPQEVEIFKMRWKRNINPLKEANSTGGYELSNFGLWAYDTIWALAMAVERIAPVHSPFIKANSTSNSASTDIENIGISETGPKLLEAILNTRIILKGLSGEFILVNGQLQHSAYEIFKVVSNRERIIGYSWTAEKGLFPKLTWSDAATNAFSTRKLKQAIWPGYSTKTPQSWSIPTAAKSLNIVYPLKQGFLEFVQSVPNKTIPQGLCIEVFLTVLNHLGIASPPPVFTAFNGTYDDLVRLVSNKAYDAAVGDTTIVADRAELVDFTLPYSEPGWSMIVKINHDKYWNMWTFLKPFSWDLWLTTLGACILTGILIQIIEHHENTGFEGPLHQQLVLAFWFPFQAVVFPQRERLVNNYSRFVMVIWLFLALILTQIYTASLSSILTVDQLRPSFFNVEELKMRNYSVGYQKDSFVKKHLINHHNFSESKLQAYSSMEDYDKALADGNNNGGVAAIFDEIPYIRLFLKKHGSKYMMAGPIYRTDGFGFAFQNGSGLASLFSKAILNVTQGDSMKKLENKYFADASNYQCQFGPIPSKSPSLSTYAFGGLFIIVGTLIILSALLSSLSSIWKRLVAVANSLFSDQPFIETESGIHSPTEMTVIGNSPEIQNPENSSEISDQNHGDVALQQQEEAHSS